MRGRLVQTAANVSKLKQSVVNAGRRNVLRGVTAAGRQVKGWGYSGGSTVVVRWRGGRQCRPAGSSTGVAALQRQLL